MGRVLYLPAVMLTGIFLVLTFFELSEISAALRLVILLISSLLFYIASRAQALKQPHKEYQIMKNTFVFMFCLYIVFLLDLVLFDSYFGRSGIHFDREGLRYYINNKINLIPFDTIRRYFTHRVTFYSFAVNIIGNLSAFAPLGFFIPLLFERINSAFKLIFTVALTVASVELLQLLMQTGSCDIDDLILNTFGAYIVYIVLKIPLIKKLSDRITVFNGKKQQQSP